MLPNEPVDYPIELDFGDKILHFRLWRGMERRLITNVIQTEGFNAPKIHDILTYSCMQESNVYLTEQEQLYVMYVLKMESLDDMLIFKYICDECGESNIELVQYADILKPKLNEFSPIQLNDITLNIGPIGNNQAAKNILQNQKTTHDRQFYELILSIKSVVVNDVIYDDYTLDEMVFFVDNIVSKLYDDLVIKFREQQFKIEPHVTCVCNNESCKHTKDIVLDVIPNFVEDWM